MERLEPHDLLRLRSPDAVHCEVPGTVLPGWAEVSLRWAPWVVVRRAYAPTVSSVPVGVRGSTRGERLATFVDRVAVAERLSPEDLVPDNYGRSLARTPALRAVGEIDELLCGYYWGPTGSVGFELASGVPVTNSESDLDLLIRAPGPLPLAAAIELSESFAALPVRVDAQLDTSSGAVSLKEYAQGREVLVRTQEGPKIVRFPWQTGSPAMQAERSVL